MPLSFPKDFLKQSWDSSFHRLGTKSWADRNTGTGQMRKDPTSPVPVTHAQYLGSLAQRFPQNMACWALCSSDTLWMGRRSGEGNVWVDKGHKVCSPNQNSGVRMWLPAGVFFLLLPPLPESSCLDTAGSQTFPVPPERKTLLAKQQGQAGVSSLKLSELGKNLGDLMQPPHATEWNINAQRGKAKCLMPNGRLLARNRASFPFFFFLFVKGPFLEGLLWAMKTKISQQILQGGYYHTHSPHGAQYIFIDLLVQELIGTVSLEDNLTCSITFEAW